LSYTVLLKGLQSYTKHLTLVKLDRANFDLDFSHTFRHDEACFF